MNFESFLDFLELLRNSLLEFGSSIFGWVFTTVDIGGNTYSIFSLILGGGVTVALGIALAKWLV